MVVSSPAGCGGVGTGPVVVAVDGELGGDGEDGRVRAWAVDVAGCGGVDEGRVEEAVYVRAGFGGGECAVRGGPVFREGDESGGVGEGVYDADENGRASSVFEGRELNLHRG